MSKSQPPVLPLGLVLDQKLLPLRGDQVFGEGLKTNLRLQVRAIHVVRDRIQVGGDWYPERMQSIGAKPTGYHQAAFDRLFPGLTGQAVTAAAVDALVQRVRQSADGLRKDRNQNRAHAFERGKPGSAKMLDFTELRQREEQSEELLNDIRLVGCGSTLSYHDMNDADCKATAEELVDAVLIGHDSRQELVIVDQ